MYEFIISTLLEQINQFKELDDNINYPIVKENLVNEKTELPYYSYDIYNRYKRITFNDYNNEPFTMNIQFKSHSDVDFQAEDMAFYLQKIIQSQQVLVNLAEKGISVLSIDALPSMNENFSVEYEFVEGLEVKLLVNDNYQDITQPGTVDDIDFELNKGEIL